MYPFFTILNLRIPTYGTMMAVAAMTALALLWLQTRKTPLWADTFNYYFFALVGALSGAMVLYAVVTFPAILSHWDELIAPLPFWEAVKTVFQLLGGFVFYGGVLGGIAAMFIYSRVFKTPLLPYTDVFAPVVPALHAIGRVGCFLGGCCYGVTVPNTHPLAVVYPPESLGAPAGVPLLALPLIEAGVNLVIALCLFCLKKSKRLPTGALTACYLMTYAVARFVLENYRGDIVRGVYYGLSTSQYVSVFLFISGIILFTATLRNRAKKVPQ